MSLATGAMLAAAPAKAQTALSRQFVSPTGTVLATDKIDIMVRLTARGGDFSFDLDTGPPWALGDLFAANGHSYNLGLFNEPFASYTQIGKFVSRNCSGSFTGVPGNACTALEYSFSNAA